MADSFKHANGSGSAIAHPVEKTKELTTETARGQSARTPFLAVTGVAAVVASVVAVVVLVTLVLYFLV